MTIREMRDKLGDTQKEFASRYGIPFRSIQNWESGDRTPPDYLLSLLEKRVLEDSANRRTFAIPKRDPKKKELPKRRDFVGGLSWLRAVNKALGKPFVFALDSALMCQESFLGRINEYTVYGYGDDSLMKYNGIVILGNSIDEDDVEEKGELRFTSLQRTLVDSLANESILYWEGIAEALSNYYFVHGDSFEGLYVPLQYRKSFEYLKQWAIEYFDN